MRNCAIEGCPSCHGRLDTKSPTYEEATEHEKSIWYDCRRKAQNDDFDASEAAYRARTLEDLEEELGQNKNEEERLIRLMDAYECSDGGKINYKELFGKDIRTGITVIEHKLERSKLMLNQQDLNRWIDWKVNGIPEGAYRNAMWLNNPYKKDSGTT